MILVVLVGLLDVVLVLLHAFLEVTLILQVTGLLSQLLNIREDYLHIQVISIASLSLVYLFRDKGSVSLPRV